MNAKSCSKYVISASIAWLAIGLWPNSAFRSDLSGRVEASAPSLFEAFLDSSLIYNADPGGMLPLNAQSYEESTFLEPLLWSQKVGSGRPTQPFDGYNFGYLDPIQNIWKTAIPGNFLKFISAVNLTYLFLFCLCVVFVFRHFCDSAILRAIAPVTFYSAAQVASYPNMFCLLQQMIALLICTEIFLDWHGRGEPRKRHFVWWSIVAIIMLSSAAFVVVPFGLLSGMSFLFLFGARRISFKASFFFVLGVSSTLLAAAPAILPTHLFQALSTNASMLYIGYGFQMTNAIKALSSFGPWTGLGISIIAGSAAAYAFGQRKILLAPFLFFSTLTLLGIAGAFDPLQLALGLNIQAANTYLPVLVFLLVVQFYILLGLPFSIASQGRPWIAKSAAIVAIVVSVTTVARSHMHSGRNGIILIQSLVTPSKSDWSAHPANLGIYEDQFRTVSLHHRTEEHPTNLTHLTSENVNWFYLYPLSAPLLRLSEATGGSSLTLANYSDFLDVINYGVRWQSTRHPQRAAWPLYQALMAEGKIGHSDTPYGEMAQQKRNNLLIWNPDSPLLKYTGIKWILSAQVLTSQRFKLVRRIENPQTYGREFALANRIGTLYVYELKDALGKAWFPTRIENSNSFGDPDQRFQELLRSSETDAVAIANEASDFVETKQSGAGNRVLIYKEKKNAIDITVRANSDALLVLSVPWFPGWKASSLGRDLKIFGINETFMGVRLPPGTQTVTFEFSPAIINWSLIIGLFGFLGILTLALGIRWLNSSELIRKVPN